MADLASAPAWWQAASDRAPIIVSTLVVLLAVVAVQYVSGQRALAGIPLLGAELGSDEKRRQAFLTGARQLYIDGYNKFKDGIFRMITNASHPVVLVSPKFLDELKKLPDDTLSFYQAIDETMHAKYTRLETKLSVVPHTIKTGLTPALVRLNPTIADEVQESFRRELPPCDDWTSINVHSKLLRIVALVSGRVFVGTELSRTEEYLDIAIKYTLELMEGRRAVENVRPWLRPFVANRLPEIKKLHARINEAIKFLEPIVAARRSMNPDERPDDMLRWLMEGEGKYGVESTAKLALMQLELSFAAIHTTTTSATNALYNLAAFPQYIPELRDEIRTVLAEHDNTFSSPALQAMKKLDSFLRETMRYSPLGVSGFQRRVLKPFTLSNGQVIPAGVNIEVPAYAVSHDASEFPDPEKFDAWRFYNLRQEARDKGQVEAAAQNQLVSVSSNILSFGYGRHACPGRFFAANEIKMIMANIILGYDVKMPDGIEGRYPNIWFGVTSIPDPTKSLLFKKI